MSETRKTGRILPRNYGIRLQKRFGHFDMFIPPSSYILAQLALETPEEIRGRISDRAERNGRNPEEVKEEFVKAVVKREGTKNILNNSRRTESRQIHNLALRSVSRQGRVFEGKVKSKGREWDDKFVREGYYTFYLVTAEQRRGEINIGYPGSRTETLDNLFSEGKFRQATAVGIHLAVPEIAFYWDNKENTPQKANMTGLLPADREPTPELPFTFNFFKRPDKMSEKEKRLHSFLTDLIMDYYLEEKSQFELSVDALKNPEIYSQTLVEAIKSPQDLATFKVMRQKEEEVSQGKISSTKDRRYGAVTSLVESIKGYLENHWHCHFSGYCREFVGTPWETIAQRFEPRNTGPVYSIATSDEHPPIIVARKLLKKATDWWNSTDSLQTTTLSEKLGIKYRTTDDVTRNDSRTTLIIPDKSLKNSGIHIPQNLQTEYDALRRT